MKKLLIILCLLLLVSCGESKREPTPDVPAPLPVEPSTENKGDETPDISLPEAPVNVRTPEQESLDRELIMFLREQLDGAYPVKGATFTYVYNEELEGKECFVYEMKNGEETETFAIATDSSAIYHLEDSWVSIF